MKRKLFWKELFLQSDFYIYPSPQSDLYSEIVCSLTSVWWENIKVVGKYFATTFYRKQCSLLKVSPQGLLVGATRQKIIANSRSCHLKPALFPDENHRSWILHLNSKEQSSGVAKCQIFYTEKTLKLGFASIKSV